MKIVASVLFNFVFFFVALAYVIACTAQYSSYEHFGISHLLSLAFIYLFFGLLVGTVIYLFRKKFIYAIIGLLIILGSTSVWQRQFGLNLLSSQMDGLHVMTYNTRSFSGMQGGEHFGEFLEWLKEQDNHDIIVFQEIVRPEYHTLTKKLDGYHHYFYSSKGYDISGLAVFSRLPMNVVHAFSFEYPGNQCIIADIHTETEGGIRLIGAHFSSNRLSQEANALFDRADDSSRKENWSRIKDIMRLYYKGSKCRTTDFQKLIPYIEDTDRSIIMAGDFNDTPFSPFYRTISTHLNDGFLESGKGLGDTYKGKFKGLRIDYIFTSKDLKANNYKTINLPFSDHKAVEAIVSANN